MARVIKDFEKTKRIRHKQRRPRSSFGEVMYRVFALTFAAALAISYISVYVDPSDFWIPMYFGLFYIPLALLNVIMLILGAAKARRAVLIPILALLPTLAISDRFVKIGNDSEEVTGNKVKILTYNLGRYSAAGGKSTPQQSVSGIKTFIQAESADIVCLQEVSVRDSALLDACLPSYPYRACHFFKGNRYFGNVTLSRYPIAGNEVIRFPRSTNLVLASDIKVGEGMVKVFNCHLESNSISFTSLIKHLSKKATFQEEVVHVHGKLRDAAVKRSLQVKAVLESEEQSCCPTILCGDFNDMPLSYTYHELTASKKDSFVEAGSGFSGTYSVLWPLLRIDYILIPGECGVTDHTINRIPYSDHYPVSANIYF